MPVRFSVGDLNAVAARLTPYIQRSRVPETMRWGAFAHSRITSGAGNFQTSTLYCAKSAGATRSGHVTGLRRWTYAKGKQWKGGDSPRIEREVCCGGRNEPISSHYQRWLLICLIVSLGWLANHYHDNATEFKGSGTK